MNIINYKMYMVSMWLHSIYQIVILMVHMHQYNVKMISMFNDDDDGPVSKKKKIKNIQQRQHQQNDNKSK